MPPIDIINNSVVIIAKFHNPTILSEGFLVTSNLIKDYKEVNRDSIIITPPLSNVRFTNGTNMVIELERMRIESKGSNDAALKAESYFQALPHIKCKAVGINFLYNRKDPAITKWFSKHNIGSQQSIGMKFVRVINEQQRINISVNLEKDDNCQVDFNHHYQYGLEPFKDISFPFTKEYELCKKTSEGILDELF
jgi:hypothetical protein